MRKDLKDYVKLIEQVSNGRTHLLEFIKSEKESETDLGKMHLYVDSMNGVSFKLGNVIDIKTGSDEQGIGRAIRKADIYDSVFGDMADDYDAKAPEVERLKKENIDPYLDKLFDTLMKVTKGYTDTIHALVHHADEELLNIIGDDINRIEQLTQELFKKQTDERTKRRNDAGS